MSNPFSTLFTPDIGPRLVANEIRPGAPLAIVGEAPGRDELDEGKPFVGVSGRLLWALLGQHGLRREDCSVLNVCQHNPPSNNISNLEWDGYEITSGLEHLQRDLVEARPNLVLCLGGTALRALCGSERSIAQWRGSLFWSGAHNLKCLGTLHPAAVLRMYNWIQLFRFDLGKAAEECRDAVLNEPKRTLIATPSFLDVCQYLNDTIATKRYTATDIEGWSHRLRCISFAHNANYAITIPFIGANGTSFWPASEEAEIWRLIAAVLCDPSIPKVLQNYLYDGFVLASKFNTPIRGLADDIMLKHWELLPELKKSLALQASIYTKQPYYKQGDIDDEDDEKGVHSPDGPDLWRYCAMDSAVTYEINEFLNGQLNSPTMLASKRHYAFNMALLPVLNYMQCRGVAVDVAARKRLVKELTDEVHAMQHDINVAVVQYNCHTPFPYAKADMIQVAASVACFKKYKYTLVEDLLTSPKKDYQLTIHRIYDIISRWPNVEPAERGELSILLSTNLNINSNKQMCDLLYRKMALPVQYKKEKGKRTEKETTDALAMLTLYRKTNNALIKTLLILRNKNDRIEGLSFTLDHDNRCRSGYNGVGTETGRVSCYNSSNGTGKSIQTETARHKHIYTPDDPNTHQFFEADLAGADGWTVAAHCAALGDRTMLDDYLNGIKPAKVIALMYEKGAEVARWNRDAIKEACKTVSQKGWLYFACKRVQHGTNYGMKESTMSDQILKDSWNKEGDPVYVEPTICLRLQQLYLARYQAVKRWHSKCESLLRSTGKLTSASGHTRIFFGRRDDWDTLKEYLADEPQENTTYGTNLALLRLWNDPDNRNPNGSLIIDPLFHRHDAFGGQFPKARTEWARSKIRSYFNNTMTIATIPITIPFEGSYGPTWGDIGNVAKGGGEI